MEALQFILAENKRLNSSTSRRIVFVGRSRVERTISATNRCVHDSFDLTQIYPRRGALYLH